MTDVPIRPAALDADTITLRRVCWSTSTTRSMGALPSASPYTTQRSAPSPSSYPSTLPRTSSRLSRRCSARNGTGCSRRGSATSVKTTTPPRNRFFVAPAALIT